MCMFLQHRKERSEKEGKRCLDARGKKIISVFYPGVLAGRREGYSDAFEAKSAYFKSPKTPYYEQMRQRISLAPPIG